MAVQTPHPCTCFLLPCSMAMHRHHALPSCLVQSAHSLQGLFSHSHVHVCPLPYACMQTQRPHQAKSHASAGQQKHSTRQRDSPLCTRSFTMAAVFTNLMQHTTPLPYTRTPLVSTIALPILEATRMLPEVTKIPEAEPEATIHAAQTVAAIHLHQQSPSHAAHSRRPCTPS